MEVLVLGTGAADGWPNPFCRCSSCQALRAAGGVRGHTAALVDDVLLLDCGPEVPRAAERAGRPLDRVRTVLLTHSHPDHADGAALLWRAWAGRREPLQVVGPAAALSAVRDWTGPDDPVEWRPVAAGERFEVAGGHAVRAVAADHDDGAVLYDITGPDGDRLLYATDTGPLPESTRTALSGAAFDVVLLEETFGDVVDHGTGHLDLRTFPAELAELRRRGAIVDGTDVVAIHLGHRNPPTPELARRLAPWGARIVPDGTVLGHAARPARVDGPHRVLLLGGARSGKSAAAERRLAAEVAVTYLAPGRSAPDDQEWASRVAAHRARRPRNWRTVETTKLADWLWADRGPLLVDCVSTWLTAIMDEVGTWRGEGDDLLAERCDELVAAWRHTTAYVVAVSNEVGSGVVPATPSGRRFRDELGRLNARLAAESDEVVLMVAGHAVPLRTARLDTGA